MLVMGFEPTRRLRQQILSLSCLPFHHTSIYTYVYSHMCIILYQYIDQRYVTIPTHRRSVQGDTLPLRHCIRRCVTKTPLSCTVQDYTITPPSVHGITLPLQQCTRRCVTDAEPNCPKLHRHISIRTLPNRYSIKPNPTEPSR